MIISEEIQINAPLTIVWSVFTCLEAWNKWNAVCESACLRNSPSENTCAGRPISEGDCISFAIRPIIFPVRITPRITKCIPKKEIVWEGSRFGIRAEHTFTFTDCGRSVLVKSTEKFSGIGVILSRLALVPSRLHRLSGDLLASLKREAESRRGSIEL